MNAGSPFRKLFSIVTEEMLKPWIRVVAAEVVRGRVQLHFEGGISSNI